MSYRLLRDEEPGKGITRIICEQIDKAVDRLQHFNDPGSDAVHRVRVGCKKIRAALRMVRSELDDDYSRENAWFRDTAKKLAALRDASVMVTTFEHLQIHSGKPMRHEDFVWVRERLQEQFRTVLEDTDREQRVTVAIEDLEQARTRILGLGICAEDFSDLQPNLKKTLKRASKGFEKALKDPSPEHLHEWRKRIKYHMYHCRMLRNIWRKPMKGYCKTLDDLSDLLGEAHDLDVFREHLDEQQNTFGSDERMDQLMGMLDYRRDRLKSAALNLGTKVHAEKPKRWCSRMETVWNAWRSGSDTPG